MRRMYLLENNSDHYPISCSIQLCLERDTTKSNNCLAVSQRVNWKKVEQEEYRDNLLKLLSDYDITSVSPSCIDNGLVKFNNILKTAATLVGQPAVRRMRNSKLVVWSPEICCVLSEKKQAFNEWKRGGKIVTNEIEDICHAQGQLSAQVTKEEVKKAIKELNKGKAVNAMGITAEHFVYAEDLIIDSLCLILNKLFESGQVTD